MKHLFKPEVAKGIWSLLILLLVIKMAWFVVEVLWLPTMGVEYSEERGVKALYYRVKLSPNAGFSLRRTSLYASAKTPARYCSRAGEAGGLVRSCSERKSLIYESEMLKS